MLNDSLHFLKRLKENNNREWFANQRDEYERAKNSFSGFIEKLIIQINEFDSTIGPLEPKDCIFRIFRDVRFSRNKDPYKENMGAYIAKGGRKRGFAGYYFHLEPSASFISGGIYMAPTEIMRRIREDIELYSNEFCPIVESKLFMQTFESLGNEKLKRVPTGFSADSPVSEYLKLKNITPAVSLDDTELTNNNILSKTVDTFKIMSPLIAFLNRSIEGVTEA